MRTKIAATCVCMLALFTLPSVASASWGLTQQQAERSVIQAAYQEYDINRFNAAGSCAPFGQSQSQNHFWPGRHHSWACGWAADASGGGFCSGAMSIKGTTSRVYSFRYTVLRGIRCPGD